MQSILIANRVDPQRLGSYERIIEAAGPDVYYRLRDAMGTVAKDEMGNYPGTYYPSNTNTLINPGAGPATSTKLFPYISGGYGTRPIVNTGYNKAYTDLTVEFIVCTYDWNWQGANVRVLANGHTDNDNTGFEVGVFGAAPGPSALNWDVGDGSANHTISTAIQLDPAAFYHVICDYSENTNSGQMTMWINGVEQASVTNLGYGSVAVGSSTVGMGIAYNPVYQGDFFSGYLGEVAVYSKILSDDEKRRHANAARCLQAA